MSKIQDVNEENMENIFDNLTTFALEGKIDPDTLEILRGVPVVKNIAAWISIFGTVRNRFIAKKIAVFVDALQNGEALDDELLERVRKKYGDERILEEVINRIDRLRSEAHAKIYANLYKALVEEKVDWDRFTSLSHSLEALDPTVFDKNPHHVNVNWKYLSSGLMYSTPTGTFEGGSAVVPNGKFFNDFWEYGLKPYQEEINDESTV